MRKLAAALILLAFASLNAMDGVCCPDGCTREERSSPAHEQETADGLCLLCQGGVQTIAVEDACPNILIRDHAGRAPLTDLNDVLPEPPEHPPRS